MDKDFVVEIPEHVGVVIPTALKLYAIATGRKGFIPSIVRIEEKSLGEKDYEVKIFLLSGDNVTVRAYLVRRFTDTVYTCEYAEVVFAEVAGGIFGRGQETKRPVKFSQEDIEKEEKEMHAH